MRRVRFVREHFEFELNRSDGNNLNRIDRIDRINRVDGVDGNNLASLFNRLVHDRARRADRTDSRGLQRLGQSQLVRRHGVDQLHGERLQHLP